MPVAEAPPPVSPAPERSPMPGPPMSPLPSVRDFPLVDTGGKAWPRSPLPADPRARDGLLVRGELPWLRAGRPPCRPAPPAEPSRATPTGDDADFGGAGAPCTLPAAMAERDVEVCGSEAGQLRLRLLGSACDGCAGGCAGRCSLFAANSAGEFALPAPAGLPVQAGQRLRLCLDDASLRRAAWRGYGMAWLGLMVGAALGFGLGQLWGRYVDLLTLAGLRGRNFCRRAVLQAPLAGAAAAASGHSPSPCPKHE